MEHCGSLNNMEKIYMRNMFFTKYKYIEYNNIKRKLIKFYNTV